MRLMFLTAVATVDVGLTHLVDGTSEVPELEWDVKS